MHHLSTAALLGSVIWTPKPLLLPWQDSVLGSLCSMYDNGIHFASLLAQQMMQV